MFNHWYTILQDTLCLIIDILYYRILYVKLLIYYITGYFMFNLLNDRISYSIVYTALLEVITVSWFYGVNKFISNIGQIFLLIYSHNHKIRE